MNPAFHGPGVEIRWAAHPDAGRDIAAFFVRNLTAEYISHSELQGERATGPGHWSPDIAHVLAEEIDVRLNAGDPCRRAAVAFDGERLVGIALVSFETEASVPYAVLEDIVVEAGARGRGIGRAIIEWVGHQASAADCERMFLESGVFNHGAHRMFEREGFETCSVVMMKALPRKTAGTDADHAASGEGFMSRVERMVRNWMQGS